MAETNDAGDKDLLDELMGKGGAGAGKVSDSKMELPDGPLPPIPNPARELDVRPEAAPSPAKSLDSVHATSEGGDGYALTIEGEAYTKDDKNNKAEVPYKVTVKVAKLEGALALLRKMPKGGGDSFLDATVRKVIGPTFRGVRTYNIAGAVPLNAKTPPPDNIQFMTHAELEAVVKQRKAPINLKDYEGDAVALRESVMDFFLNPKDFPGREEKRSADRAERRELETLNS